MTQYQTGQFITGLALPTRDYVSAHWTEPFFAISNRTKTKVSLLHYVHLRIWVSRNKNGISNEFLSWHAFIKEIQCANMVLLPLLKSSLLLLLPLSHCNWKVSPQKSIRTKRDTQILYGGGYNKCILLQLCNWGNQMKWTNNEILCEREPNCKIAPT